MDTDGNDSESEPCSHILISLALFNYKPVSNLVIITIIKLEIRDG